MLGKISTLGQDFGGASMKFYNIHDLLKISVENLELNHMLPYFLTSRPSGTLDMVIKVGRFDISPMHDRLGRFYLRENEIIEKRKFGSMRLKNIFGKTELDATSGYIRLRPILTLIESIIGFKLLAKNHALVHSSCVSKEGKGYLISAWHDTGKTMISLKLVKEMGLSFLSEDLVIINDSGQAHVEYYLETGSKSN